MILQIEKKKAVNAFNKGDAKVKELLSNLFGTQVFQLISQETLDRFYEACKSSGFIPHDILHTGAELNIEQQVSNAYTMLRILAKEKRSCWEPDWNNSNQPKYYPYFKHTSEGFAVYGTTSDYYYTLTIVGSRLCFPSSDMAKSFADENRELYRIILLN